MKKPMTDADFAKYERLVHHMIKQYFHWAVPNDVNHNVIVRGISYDELVSEGNFALVDAWRGYDKSKGSFPQYANCVIYRCLMSFIFANCTPLTVKDYKRVMSGDDEIRQEKLRQALNCRFFSELTSPVGIDVDHSNRVANQEFTEHCIQKIKERLDTGTFQLLMDRYSGETLEELGKKRGITKEWARRLLKKAIERLTLILKDEQEMLHDSP